MVTPRLVGRHAIQICFHIYANRYRTVCAAYPIVSTAGTCSTGSTSKRTRRMTARAWTVWRWSRRRWWRSRRTWAGRARWRPGGSRCAGRCVSSRPWPWRRSSAPRPWWTRTPAVSVPWPARLRFCRGLLGGRRRRLPRLSSLSTCSTIILRRRTCVQKSQNTCVIFVGRLFGFARSQKKKKKPKHSRCVANDLRAARAGKKLFIKMFSRSIG